MSADPESRIADERAIAFGPFRYYPERRELRDGNGPVRVGSRALQLLDVLLDCPGRLHSRDELMARVWPQAEVEETSLRAHMSTLRRALGEGQGGAQYITNVPGRGYAFIADVQATAQARRAADAPAPTVAAQAMSRPPPALVRLIGRADTLERVEQLSLRERLVSVVGAGGMGKTSVALAVAEQGRERFADGAVWVDLSRLSDPVLVSVEVGQALGLTLSRGEPLDALSAALQDRHLLILLDNCEHVIDAVAALVERLIRTCPRVHVLVTSREPLEIEGEWVFKLPPLGLPESGADASFEEMCNSPAIQLFVERAHAGGDTFELSELNAAAVCQLCMFLDGIPLAIELAAARVDSLGVQGLLQRLENALDLLTRGRRPAMNRHRTLLAVLEWSYELLGEDEKILLQRLSVFRAPFDLDSAITVAADADLPRQRVIGAMLGLCAKSLAVLEGGEGGRLQHRLLYITRLFAQQRLDASPDANEVRRRHARLLRDQLTARQQAAATIVHYRWTPELVSPLPDLSAAVDWAMTQGNDLSLGLDLVALALRMHYDSGRIGEYNAQIEMALARLAQSGGGGSAIELQLRQGQVFISGSVSYGGRVQEMLFEQLQELTQRVGNVVDQLESLYSLSVAGYGQGKYRFSMARCEEARDLARGPLEPIGVILADRMSALNLHMLGEHDEAERMARRVLAFQGPRVDRRFVSVVPLGVSMRIQLARIQFLRGQFQLARATVRQALVLAEGAHMFALGQLLAIAAVPIAMWSGDDVAARQWTAELLDHCRRHGLPYLSAYGRVFEALLAGGMGASEGAELQVIEECTPLGDLFATLRPGHRVLPTTLARVQESSVGWCAPEVMRRQALTEFAAEPDDEAARQRCLQALEQALALSERQGARFWSLRLLLSMERVAQAGEGDEPIYRDRMRNLIQAINDDPTLPELRQARQLLEA